MSWRGALADARQMVDLLPAGEVGKAVLREDGSLFRGELDALRRALAAGELRFHAGAIGGAVPVVRPRSSP